MYIVRLGFPTGAQSPRLVTVRCHDCNHNGISVGLGSRFTPRGYKLETALHTRATWDFTRLPSGPGKISPIQRIGNPPITKIKIKNRKKHAMFAGDRVNSTLSH